MSILIVDGNAGRQALNGFVAGLPGGTMRIRGERVECIEVRLSPVRAYALLDVAPTDLGRAVAGLRDLWGRRAPCRPPEGRAAGQLSFRVSPATSYPKVTYGGVS